MDNKKDYKKNFGQTLRSLRKKANLTQDELSELLNLSSMTIRRWETGKVIPRVDDIKKICEVLHCSENDLLNDNELSNLNVTFYWEVDELEMKLLNLAPNDFSFGYRNDGQLLLAGAIDFNMNIDDILNRIKVELLAAKAGKIARDKTLKKFEHNKDELSS